MFDLVLAVDACCPRGARRSVLTQAPCAHPGNRGRGARSFRASATRSPRGFAGWRRVGVHLYRLGPPVMERGRPYVPTRHLLVGRRHARLVERSTSSSRSCRVTMWVSRISRGSTTRGPPAHREAGPLAVSSSTARCRPGALKSVLAPTIRAFVRRAQAGLLVEFAARRRRILLARAALR